MVQMYPAGLPTNCVRIISDIEAQLYKLYNNKSRRSSIRVGVFILVDFEEAPHICDVYTKLTFHILKIPIRDGWKVEADDFFYRN